MANGSMRETLMELVFLRTLVRCNVGTRTSLHELLKVGKGEMSKHLGKAVTENSELESVLFRASEKVRSERIRTLLRGLSLVVKGPDPIRSIDLLYEEVRNDFRIRAERFVKSLPGIAELFYTLVLLLPLMLVTAWLLLMAFRSAAQYLPIPSIDPQLPLIVGNVFLALSSAVFLVIVLRRRKL
jgi:hypothetical protein